MNYRIILVGSALAGWTVLTLLDAAAKAGVLLVMAMLVILCMRRSSAASRHLIWLCALTGALLLPIGFKFLPQWRVLPSWMKWEEVPQLLSGTGPVATAFSDMAEEPTEMIFDRNSGNPEAVRYIAAPKVESPKPKAEIIRFPAKWFIRGWSAVVCVLLLPLAVSAFSLQRKASLARRVTSGPLMDELDLVKRELGVRRHIALLVGGPDAMPMVWGIMHCHLLLPEGVREWPAQRLRSVLLHEVSHLRRHDPLALLIAHLALAIHWFNPLAWHALRQLRIEQENACDDCVLRHGVLSSDYAADMLATSASFRTSTADRFGALTMARSLGMEARISGILDASRNRRTITRRLILSCSAVASLAAFPLAMLGAGDAGTIVRGQILDRNGAVLAESADGKIRNYPFGATAAHRLGYVSKSRGGVEYRGVSGAELVHDNILAQGKDVRLTLDVSIQQTVAGVMAEAGVGSGAAVILDCRNGDLLANVSLPSYDLNDFVPEISREKFDGLQGDPEDPFLDRTVLPATPGSSFKLVTALAAARSGQAGQVLECTGYKTYGNARVGCWIMHRDKGMHGKLDLQGGLVHSCNCYFGQLANKIGIEGLEEAGDLLGLGKPSGSGYPNDNAGVFPGSRAAEKITPGVKATPHDLAMLSIGQGISLATPMQLAVLAAAVGKGEKVWVPRLSLEGPPQFRTDLLEQGWKPDDIAVIRSGMRDCVMSDAGVSRSARAETVEIAGTGATAMTSKRGESTTVAWFVGYAPADDPQFAIAVMVEGGDSGTRVCGPIAKSIFEKICDEASDTQPADSAQ
jgi:beta-lactamase regulating signal transducer with metallopeptidase domain